MTSSTEQVWDTAANRRALRLLVSHSPRIDDPQSTARALRLVSDIVQRRGAPTEIFQIPGTMPLVVVGHGPILLLTHLDDPHPSAQGDEPGPPSMAGDVVTAPGITRKAGVLAALGAVLGDEEIAELVTLVIEADRHDGSTAFASWLENPERNIAGALLEVADLPIPAPAVFLAATGVVTIGVIVQDNGVSVERAYGGVQPDVGHLLVSTLSALKSVEGEVLVPRFYDGVVTPDANGLAALRNVATSVGAWLTRDVPPSDDQLSSSHLTLGAFLAPSIVVRDVRLDGTGPYLPRAATAEIEARIMPGQDAATVARSIATFVLERIPDALVETLLLRPSAKASAFDAPLLEEIAPIIPVAIGNSPAGLLDSLAVPHLGFSTVWRDPAALDEQISMSAIMRHSQTLRALVRVMAQATGTVEPPR
ncbi:MAG TPA: hypothetical protein VEX37_10960 [Thermomicrobiales bacterium]|nr:hypothetical protein [Thermomicrobiales bacterium]